MRQEPRSGAPVVHGSERAEPTRNKPKPQPPAWVPELVAVLIDLHRKRSTRFAHVGLYAELRGRRQPPPHFPDQAA